MIFRPCVKEESFSNAPSPGEELRGWGEGYTDVLWRT